MYFGGGGCFLIPALKVVRRWCLCWFCRRCDMFFCDCGWWAGLGWILVVGSGCGGLVVGSGCGGFLVVVISASRFGQIVWWFSCWF